MSKVMTAAKIETLAHHWLNRLAVLEIGYDGARKYLSYKARAICTVLPSDDDLYPMVRYTFPDDSIMMMEAEPYHDDVGNEFIGVHCWLEK